MNSSLTFLVFFSVFSVPLCPLCKNPTDEAARIHPFAPVRRPPFDTEDTEAQSGSPDVGIICQCSRSFCSPFRSHNMPTRNVVLSAHQQQLVETLVQSGRYQNASEVLREGLRLIEERE